MKDIIQKKFGKKIDSYLNKISNKEKYMFYIIKIFISIVGIFIIIKTANILSNNILKMNMDSKIKKKGGYKYKKDSLTIIASTVVRYLIYLFGFYGILSFLGFNTSLILATFGTLGVSIALGLQGAFSNIMSGILLTITNTYRIGDIIETSAMKGSSMNSNLIGKIINYNLLTMKIKEVNTGILFTIPNKILWDNIVGHYDYFEDRIYPSISIVISPENDFKKVLKITHDLCINHKDIIKEETGRFTSPFINLSYKDMRFGVFVIIRFLTNLDSYPHIMDTLQNDILLKFKENNIKLKN